MENKEPKKNGFSLGVLLLFALFTFLLGGATTSMAAKRVLGDDFLSILKAGSTIEEKFVGGYDAENLADQSIYNMVASLDDRWSYFLDEESYQRVMATRKNVYIGLGITISSVPMDGIEILKGSPNSVAYDAGMVAGDVIISVDGVAITQENQRESLATIRGEEGTALALGIRTKSKDVVVLTLVLEELQTEVVGYEMLENQVGYVKLSNFYDDSGALFIAAVETLVEQGAQSLVFDLRYNPGGYIGELIEMLDYLLPEGQIFISKGVDGKEKIYESDGAYVDLKMGVIVHAESYSAAEFFAAQLREMVDAVVVGELTSGKGYSQQLFPLPNGSAIGISTARYFTGGGESLIGVGVVPDQTIALTEEQAIEYRSGGLSLAQDPQVQGMLTLLAQ